MSLLALMVSTCSLALPQSLLAQTRTKTYRVGHSYSGVHRCGHRQENMKEARIAAENKVKELRNRFQGDYLVRLNNFSYKSSTRNWEEKDRFGFSKGRKCQTTMEVTVLVNMRPSDW